MVVFSRLIPLISCSIAYRSPFLLYPNSLSTHLYYNERTDSRKIIARPMLTLPNKKLMIRTTIKPGERHIS